MRRVKILKVRGAGRNSKYNNEGNQSLLRGRVLDELWYGLSKAHVYKMFIRGSTRARRSHN